jgi:hypothetical protein
VWVIWLAFGSLGLLWLASQVLAPVYLDRALVAQALLFYVALAGCSCAAGCRARSRPSWVRSGWSSPARG